MLAKRLNVTSSMSLMPGSLRPSRVSGRLQCGIETPSGRLAFQHRECLVGTHPVVAQEELLKEVRFLALMRVEGVDQLRRQRRELGPARAIGCKSAHSFELFEQCRVLVPQLRDAVRQ